MPLDAIPTSRWTPKPPSAKFRWYQDPADSVRARGKANVTSDETKQMLEYNRRLTAPDGGSGLFQPPAAPPAAQLPTTNAGIEAQYSTGRPGFVSVRPSSPSAPVTYPIAPATTPPTIPSNPALTSTPQVAPPALNGAPHSLGGTETGTPAAPSAWSALPSGGSGFEGSKAAPINPNTGSVAAGGKTIADEESERIARLRAQGASDADIHRIQVQHGIRPNIDARTVQSPLNSTASAEIQAGWAKQKADKLAQLRQSATQ